MNKYKFAYRPIELTYRKGEISYEIALNKSISGRKYGILAGLNAYEKWEKATGIKKWWLGIIWGFKSAKVKPPKHSLPGIQPAEEKNGKKTKAPILVDSRFYTYEKALKNIPKGYRMMNQDDANQLAASTYYHNNHSIIFLYGNQQTEINIPLIRELCAVNDDEEIWENYTNELSGTYWLTGGEKKITFVRESNCKIRNHSFFPVSKYGRSKCGILLIKE